MISKLIDPASLLTWAQRNLFGSIPGKNGSARRLSDSRLKNQAVEQTSGSLAETVNESSGSEFKKTLNRSVVTYEGTYQGKPIRVRIYNESV